MVDCAGKNFELPWLKKILAKHSFCLARLFISKNTASCRGGKGYHSKIETVICNEFTGDSTQIVSLHLLEYAYLAFVFI